MADKPSTTASTRRRPIFLIGFMASGKTTLGHAVAAATGIGFVDLDDYIVSREGRSITEIFADGGEAAFRRAERSALESLLSDSAVPGLIACGGGTPCFGNNLELMDSCGQTVWLDAPVDIIVSRLKEARNERPLVASLSDDELAGHVCARLDERRPYYSRSASRFDSGRLDTPEQIDKSVSQFIKRFLKD